MFQSLIGKILASLYIDLEGNPVKRTPRTHPYSYDAYVQWRGGANDEITSSVYSDRMIQWDYQKFTKLREKHFGNGGQYFGGRNPAKIESFLRDYFDQPQLRLVVIQQCCNVSSGYPIWIFQYHLPQPNPKN